MIEEILPPDTRCVFRAMQVLRTDLKDEESFAQVIDEVQRPEGYRLVGAFEETESDAVAVAGFRTGHSLSWGHYVYVDDLSTVPEARRRGHGRALLNWLGDEAARLGCSQLHLDSGVGFDRANAHRLYMNAGMIIASYHFARRVPG
jgi:GNAT superfamily N-acetyltransferase